MRKIIGKTRWLAEKCHHDYLSYGLLKLPMKSEEVMTACLKFTNAFIGKIKTKTSKIIISPVVQYTKDLIVVWLSDSAYKAGDKAVGRYFVLLLSKKNDKVVPTLWKSSLI